jgi:hypothetical protein
VIHPTLAQKARQEWGTRTTDLFWITHGSVQRADANLGHYLCQSRGKLGLDLVV